MMILFGLLFFASLILAVLYACFERAFPAKFLGYAALFAVLLLCGIPVFGQVRYDSYVVTSAKNVPPGAQAPIYTLPYSRITVCTYQATDPGQPCTPTTPIYYDQGLTQPITQPLVADPQGRFGFWMPSAGMYSYSVVSPSSSYYGTYGFTVGSGMGSGVSTVSGTGANGISVSVTNPSTTPAIVVTTDGTHVIPTNTGSPTQYLNGTGAYTTPPGGGTVSSVGLTMPSIFNVASSPITGSGVLAATFANQAQATVLAAPTGSTGTPQFRALVGTDLPQATAFAFGAIKPDNTSCTVTSGVLTCGGGGSVGAQYILQGSNGSGSFIATSLSDNGSTVSTTLPFIAKALNNTFYTSSVVSLASCLTLAASVSGTCVMPAGYTETLTAAGPTMSTAGVKLIGQPGSSIVGSSGTTALTVAAANVIVDGVTFDATGSGGSTLTVRSADNITIRNTQHFNCGSYCINVADVNNLWLDGNTETTASASGSTGIFYQNTSKATTGLRITHNICTINGSGECILIHSNNTTFVANDIDIEGNVAYLNSGTAGFGVEVGNFGSTINPAGGKVSGNVTVLGANGNGGGVSLNAQDSLMVSGNTLDANNHTWTIEGVELAQGSNHNTVVGNHIINAPSTNTGGSFDVNGGNYNKLIGNDAYNVGAFGGGYSPSGAASINSNNNLFEGNSITLSASSTTKGVFWLQSNENTISPSVHSDNNIVRDNIFTSNGTVQSCMVAEGDSGTYPGYVVNTLFEGNQCLGFSGSWSVYTNYANYPTVTTTVLSKNVAGTGGTATEISDTAGSVVKAEDIGFAQFTNQTIKAAGFTNTSLVSQNCIGSNSSGTQIAGTCGGASQGLEYTVQAANGSGGFIAVSLVDNGTNVATTEPLTAATFTPSTSRKSTFTCTAGGTITVSNTLLDATSDVLITLKTAGGTISTVPALKTATAGTGFTVLCGAADTSVYNYSILN